MGTDERSTNRPRESQWRWPREPAFTLQRQDDTQAEVRKLGLPHGVVDNDVLRRAVIDGPEDEAPRHEYAAWMTAQGHGLAKAIGAFIGAQLRVAQAFRDNRGADVADLRRWNGDTAYVSMTAFRAGDVLRPWFVDGLSPLLSLGLVGWPQVYRGFVERVGVRAYRFLQISDELFRLAPIRYLVVIGVPEVVDELAACPHLARVRSLSLPRYGDEDELTDDALRRLLASPYLGQLAHLRLVHQRRLTPRAYEDVVTASTLAQLSSFEIFSPRAPWDHLEPTAFDPGTRSDRMIGYDTPIRSMRAKDWVNGLERAVGYVPCVHPEEHYGWAHIDVEAIVERPIALDADVMRQRGRPVSCAPATQAGPR